MCDSFLVHIYAAHTFPVESLCDRYQQRSQYLLTMIEKVAKNSKTIVSDDLFRAATPLKVSS